MALTALACTGWPASALARGDGIALTFDDLPALTILPDQAYVNYLNAVLLSGLRRHHLPAIGFVNEGKLDQLDRTQQIAVLRAWLSAGMDLGNHTFSHESPATIGASAYIADIARGEPVTRALLAEHHKKLRWFRHPYLETGAPAPVRARIDHWLAAHGYRVAPVTVDANDWQFAEPYDDAIARHDEVRRRHIRRLYLDYTRRTLRWYQSAAHALFGRGISYVMLLHATRLNADCIDDLAAMLKQQGLHGITLDHALRDPAYRTPDHDVTSNGDDWLNRWAATLHRDLPWDSFRDPPAQIVAQYNRVDADQDEASVHAPTPETSAAPAHDSDMPPTPATATPTPPR